LMVPVRDGLRLATDVYRPAQDGKILPGPYPALLCRTPYVKSSARYVEIAEFYVPRGYVVALQDLRGRGRSEGTGQYYLEFRLRMNGSVKTETCCRVS
jgi:putative CocE/NonD family hydrolase